MGIKGLLPLLKNIYDEINIDKYKGQKVAVDTYCWLHKAVFSCSYELVLGRPTTKHIVYCVNRVKKLLALGVTPVMVFDGARLEQKADEERERRKKRRENKEKGMRFLGKGNIKEATKYFQRAVDVKPEMAHQLITELRKLNVECIVAPYEADAQLAYLSITDKVSCVITEDSDLLVFGCKAVLFKMDSAGNGTEIRLEDLGQVSSVNFGNWTQRMLQEMCVLSGCDYLPSIPRIGLKKAYNLIHHYRNLEKAVRHLRHEGKYDVPDRYEQRAERAVLTFRHQLVFDPSKRDQTNLREIPSYLFKKELTFLGELFRKEDVAGVMRGDLDPMTLEPFEKAQQICSNAGTPVRAKPKRKVLVEISNKLTDYFEKVSSDNSVTIKMSKTETVEIKKEIKLKTRRRKRNGFQSELSLLEADKENKSAFLRAKRLSTRRNFGGINFKVELLEENK